MLEFLPLDFLNALDVTDAILLAVSFVIGILISLLFSRPRIGRRDAYIDELEESITTKEKNMKVLNKTLKETEASMKDLNAELLEHTELNTQAGERIAEQDDRIRVLETSLKEKDAELEALTGRAKEQDSTLERLRAAMGRRDETLKSLEGQLQERNDDIGALKEETADLDNRTRQMIGERDAQIVELTSSIETRDENIDRLNRRLQEQETKLDDVSTQLSQRESIIEGQNFQIQEQNNYINALKEEKAALEERIQNVSATAEETATRELELGETLHEKERELARLRARTLRMHDDLTQIAGIGVKISSVLKSAGIDTFEKLATTEIDGIRGILEAENPSLLRLTDPSTWPEQARIAADGDWEALSNLQTTIKAARA